MHMAVQQDLSAVGMRLRRAARWPALLAAVLLGLLLAQPAFCVIHCAIDAHLISAAPRDTDTAHMLCTLGERPPSPQSHIPIPAFWPCLPITTAAVLAVLTLLMVLNRLPPAGLISISWSPRPPPPRAN